MLVSKGLFILVALTHTLYLQSVTCTLEAKTSAIRHQSLVEPVFSYDDYGIQNDAIKSKHTHVLVQQPETSQSSAAEPAHRIKSLILSASPYTSSALHRSPFALLSLSEEPVKLSNTAAKKEEPHHWSALENYYQKLRQSQPSASLLRVPFEQHYGAAAIEPTIMDYWNIRQQPLSEQRPLRLIAPPASYYPDFKLVSGGTTSNLATPQKQLHLPPLVDADLDKITQQQIPLTTQELLFPSQLDHQQQHQKQQQQQQHHLINSGYDYPISYGHAQLPWADLVQRPIETLVIEDGRPESSWRRRLPELLQLRQLQEQQLRAKHQLATFGNWYDYQRTRELLQEEAYCGPRNYVGLHGTTKQANNGGSSPSAPSDYPSHVGIYNDTSYLCAGSWISDSYVLTIASCVSGLEANHLQVKFNEWNAHHHHQDTNASSAYSWASLPLPGPTPVDQVHLFPKFREAREHNLALLRLATPVDYLASAYVVPACQAQARSLLRASACWAPVRNISRAEYFDPTGDGETRERLLTTMLEKPVKLVVRDEMECKRSTGSELFNFQHPNFICSADLKRNDWRLKLNSSEAFGSGIYCDEGGRLTLVSLVHPVRVDQPSSSGYLDLTYYRPWMRNIMSGQL